MQKKGVRAVRRERGIALVFALGLLSLLLCLGVAFVGNALVNRKVARNNSGRTQAKILALSAINRAAAAIMLYQEQLSFAAPGESFAGNFSAVCSFSDGGGAILENAPLTMFNDGLLGDDSLMLLPEDDSVLPRASALSFNARFKSGALFPWQGRWNYFFDKASGSDRRIIGRAAWQVISSPAQILTPVFFRGHLGDAPGKFNVSSNMCRWGRDIFEADLSGTRLFANVESRYNGDHITDFESCIIQGMISAENDGDRRWLERWLLLDPDPDLSINAAWEPNASQLVPETYVYQPENAKEKRVLCRFNISDLYTPAMTEAAVNQKYGVSAEADPWYARFRIDSTISSDVNVEKALAELTRDGAPYANHKYDYELTDASSRSGLPFLRRIGADKGTFDTIVNLRKQIAANFNDYCDADFVPTSDVPAQNWGNAASEPIYTGNEKTPYLYEFGALAALIRDPVVGTLEGDVPGIACTLTPAAGTAARSLDFTFGLRLAPVVKLANMYAVKEDEMCRNLQAEMDFGEVAVSFRISCITLKGVKFRYRSGGRYYSKNLNDWTVGETEWSDYPSLSASGLASGEFSVTVKGDEIVSGEALSFPKECWENNVEDKPYPLRYFSQVTDLCADANAKVWHTVTANTVKGKLKFNGKSASSLSLNLSAEEVRKIAAARELLPSSYSNFSITSQPTALSVDQIVLTGFSVRPRRVMLTAERVLTGGTTERFGIDYVREFQNYPFAWSSSAGVKLDFSASPKAGVLWGGIRNYDPRQNLNNADWYPYPEPGETALKAMPLLTVVHDYTQVDGGEIAAVIRTGEVNIPYSGTLSAFDPAAQNDDAENPSPGDAELSSTPARSATAVLSTAVIRNAPMMSPWEIGMIHRGVRWQTINLKNSSSPSVADSPVRLSDHAPNGDRWDNVGTTYCGGDAGLLDQIKMCQLGATYGKINFNMLWRGEPEFDPERDADMFRALFEGIFYGEEPQSFIANSTRNGEGLFPSPSSGVNALLVPDGRTISAFDKMSDAGVSFPKTLSNQPSSLRYTSRAQIVDYLNGEACLANAFGLVPENESLKDDAHYEEMIGKTINLLTTETTSPDKVYVVVIAQIIRDGAGTRYLASTASTSEFTTTNQETLKKVGDLISLPCQYGRFDAAIHQTDSEKNLYFDEITGEVKLFATLKRDPETGRISLEKINDIE